MNESLGAKCYSITRTVVLHNVQEFIVTNVRDEFEAQELAEAMIASHSLENHPPPPNVRQIRCETIDPGECNYWRSEETQS